MTKVKAIIVMGLRDILNRIASDYESIHESDNSPDENELTEIHGSLNDLHARTNVLIDKISSIHKTSNVVDKRLATNEDAIGSLAQRIGDLHTKSDVDGKAMFELSQKIRNIEHGLFDGGERPAISQFRRDEGVRVDTINKSIESLGQEMRAAVVDLGLKVEAHESELLTLTHPDHHNGIVARIEKLEEQPLAASHNHLCKATDGRFTAVEARIEVHEERLNIQTGKGVEATRYCDALADRINDLFRRVDGVESRLDAWEHTISANAAFGRALDERVTAVDAGLTNRLDEITNPKTFQKDIFARLDKIENIAIRNLTAKIRDVENSVDAVAKAAATHEGLVRTSDALHVVEKKVNDLEARVVPSAKVYK